MFVGHYAVGFALKRVEPKLNLGLLVLAAAWLDMVLPALVLLGVEHMRIRPDRPGFLVLDIYSMPWSHSVAAVAVWSLLAFLLYRYWPDKDGRKRLRPALVLAAAVASHFLLDLLAHTPDLPLFSNDTVKLGFGLWRNIPVSTGLELLILVSGILLYASSFPKKTPFLTKGLILFTVFQAGYLVGCYYGLLPRTPEQFAWRLLIEQPAFFAVLAWFDRTAERSAA